MLLQLRPISKALLRNWAGPALVAAQIAITLGVLANATYIVKQRIDRIRQPTGMDVENIFVVHSVGISERFSYEATTRADLAYLRGLPGVIAATAMDNVPLSGHGNFPGLLPRPKDPAKGTASSYFEVDEQVIAALGLRLVAGRAFRPDEVLPPRIGDGANVGAPQVIVTQALARELFPRGDALGKSVYDIFGLLASPATIIGIVQQMHGSHVGWRKLDNVYLVPRLPAPDGERVANYVVRARPGQRDALMRTVEARLADSNRDRMIEWIRPLQFFKDRAYAADRNMEVFLVSFGLMLIVIACISIYGLAAFNVGMRTKQIGTRRALGARRVEIVSYFLVENALMSSVGIVVGCVLSLVGSTWLSRHYALPRLDLRYLVASIPVVLIIGQLAAWRPARRAAAIPPAVATRTV